jgi:uncharacterized membrane protein HdeD (DUF308 family)
MLTTFSQNWWALVVRGALAALFGVLTLLLPGLTLTALVLIFGVYALVDGIGNVYIALSNRRSNDNWLLTLLEGVAGILAGILTIVLPGMTALILLYIIAFWAITPGVLEIAASIQLRRDIDNEWLLGLSGVLSIFFGVVLMIAPGSGALAIAWLIGVYAIVFGATMILLGFRLRNDPQSLMMPGAP